MDQSSMDESHARVTEALPQRTPPLRLTRLLRRGHMYAGLMFLPWVLLYGVTALFFNHPTVLTRRQTIDDDVSAAMLTSWPRSEQLAAQAAQALAAAPDGPGELTSISNARYNGNARAVVHSGSDRYELQLRPEDRSGTWSPLAPPKNKAEAKQGRPESVSLPLPSALPPREKLRDEVHAGAKGMPFPADKVELNQVPVLKFDAFDRNGARWDATWNLETGGLKAQRMDEKSLSARDYLTRLHRTVGYPANDRWDRMGWAIAVDAVFALMLFWAVSGIVMWWQQRRQRFVGGVILAAGATGATVLGVALWRAFVG